MNDKKYEQLINFYKDLIENITTEEICMILESLDIPYLNRASSNIVSIKTCCHNVDLNTAKYNLKYYKETKSFMCFSECSCSYDLIALLQQTFKIRGDEKSFIQTLKFICDILDIPFNYQVKENKIERYNWEKELSKYIGVKEDTIEENKIYEDSILNRFEKIYHESWVNFGISFETFEKYNIRYYPYLNQIVIPCYNEANELIGIRVRNMDKEKLNNGVAKYIPLKLLDGTEYNFKTGLNFYGEQNFDNIRKYKKCVIVEAEKSTLLTDTWFKENCTLALFGKNMTDIQARTIIELGVEEVIIAIDFDYEDINSKEFRQYKKDVFKIANYFKNLCYVSVMFSGKGHKKKENAIDMGYDKYMELYNRRIKLK